MPSANINMLQTVANGSGIEGTELILELMWNIAELE